MFSPFVVCGELRLALNWSLPANCNAREKGMPISIALREDVILQCNLHYEMLLFTKLQGYQISNANCSCQDILCMAEMIK